MYLAYNNYGVLVGASDQPIQMEGCRIEQDPNVTNEDVLKMVGKMTQPAKKTHDQLRIAVICNWNDSCGISTYTKFLVDALSPKVKEIGIFSEENDHPTIPDDSRVTRCWKRGHSMRECVLKVLAWKPDFVIVQHEFGIFPKANYFLQMLQMLETTPYAVCLHSVYRHLDKTICTAAIKNIVVHSEQGKQCLRELGHDQNIFVLPHGCVKFDDVAELWNIFQVPYVLVQFGFGFYYKGVDRVLEALSVLKKQEKFKDIFYVYLCSDSGKFDGVHNNYYSFLMDKIDALRLHDNVSVVRKYHSEAVINNYLRTAKIALFPYTTDPKHVVYGASGAVRVAIGNDIPVIASESHMFDDLEGVLPRPDSAEKLAREIDEIFSSDSYRNSLKEKIRIHAEQNTWDHTANKYLEVYNNI